MCREPATGNRQLMAPLRGALLVVGCQLSDSLTTDN
jgi:hypothetical protein